MPITISILGGSGYTGGELIRLLLPHPHVQVAQVTSERLSGKSITRAHPNLRGHTDLKFSRSADLEPCDVLFTCLPHGSLMHRLAEFESIAPRIIDLSADFRLRNPTDYQTWYSESHGTPDKLSQFVYGIAELHREKIKTASFIAGAGCNATTTLLGLYPLVKHGLVDLSLPIIAEAKVGSSEAGNKSTEGSHHPERSRTVRSFKPVRHRHTPEILQELTFGNQTPQIYFSATAVELVRGILVTSHIFVHDNVTEKDIWKAYRAEYESEPFIRIVKERQGIHRYPDPKILTGTNFCDIGFEKDPHSNRVVILSALDNLIKGAAGQAVQALNLMCGWEETTGLEFMGLHPL